FNRGAKLIVRSAELAHGSGQHPPDFGEPFWSDHQEGDHEDEEQLLEIPAEIKHYLTPNGLTPPPAPQHDPRSRTGGRRAATNLTSNNDNARRSPLASSWKPTQSHPRHRPTRTSSRAAGRRASRAGWTAGTTASPIRRMGHLGE